MNKESAVEIIKDVLNKCTIELMSVLQQVKIEGAAEVSFDQEYHIRPRWGIGRIEDMESGGIKEVVIRATFSPQWKNDDRSTPALAVMAQCAEMRKGEIEE